MSVLRASVLLFLVAASAGFSQSRSPALDSPSTIVLPEDYRTGMEFPVVVFLPYTNGDSEEQARAFGFRPGEHEGAVMVLPPGRFSTQDYLPDFLQFVEWYEERLLEDLRSLEDTYSVDTARVVLAGYSLGGDLAWALSVRNPRLFAGAVIGGSRSSYPVGQAALRELVDNAYRGAFLIGDSDSPQRFDGLNLARSRLEGAGGEVLYREYPGGHVNPPVDIAQEALNFTLGGDRATITSTIQARTGTRASRAASRTLFGTGVSGPTDRIILHADIPLDVSGRFSTGVGLASENRIRISGETLVSRLWLRGQLGYRALRPVALPGVEGGTVHAMYGEASVAFGSAALWGAGVEWNWEQWITGADLSGDGNSRSIRDWPVLWVHYVNRGSEAYVPRLTVSLGYRLPQAFSGVPVEHYLGFRAQSMYRPFTFLRLGAGAGVDTQQVLPLDGTIEFGELLQVRVFGLLSADLSIGPHVRLGVNWRPTRTQAAGETELTLLESIWQAELSYVLF